MDDVKSAAEQAFGTIVQQLSAPYFFEKLAANGVVPRSDKEAADMWAIGCDLHVLYTAEQEKAAAAEASNLSAARARVGELLKVAGLASTDAADEKAAAFNGAADVAAEQADIASAVLTLQAAAAAALQNTE
jgi:hypothetical protein